MLHLIAMALVAAQPLTPTIVRVGDGQVQTRLLTSGTRRYVRYLVKPDGGRQLVDIWQRTIERAPLPGSAMAGLHMVQRWDSVVDGSTQSQDSWFADATLAPVTHIRLKTKDDRIVKAGYVFAPDGVTAMAALAEGSDPSFRMPMREPSFNFEYDMELFETLPLAAGMVFDVPFYDAGIDKAPARYRFTVAGSEVVAGPDGRPIDCWLLTGDYRTGKVLNRFWITKASQVVIREEGRGPGSKHLVKALLPPESADQD